MRVGKVWHGRFKLGISCIENVTARCFADKMILEEVCTCKGFSARWTGRHLQVHKLWEWLDVLIMCTGTV
jgi:hypothetical protein